MFVASSLDYNKFRELFHRTEEEKEMRRRERERRQREKIEKRKEKTEEMLEKAAEEDLPPNSTNEEDKDTDTKDDN